METLLPEQSKECAEASKTRILKDKRAGDPRESSCNVCSRPSRLTKERRELVKSVAGVLYA